jgi:hypothetical protein
MHADSTARLSLGKPFLPDLGRTMRLLEYNDEGEFRLTGTFSDETP